MSEMNPLSCGPEPTASPWVRADLAHEYWRGERSRRRIGVWAAGA